MESTAREETQDTATELDADTMQQQAEAAADFIKALSHEGRLMILCYLCSGEKSVTELERLLSTRQAAVSQQLARLRADGLVSCRREGKVMYYRLADSKARKMIDLIYGLFCGEAGC